jgi:YidC/Oxa1 family membrane protein insertase
VTGFFEIFAAGLAGFYAFIPSYGVAIILLTLAVRVLLLPLSIKQTRSQREMQRIMPEVKAIQKKHKGDRQKINEATMALYKEHGVNPLGGCLPLLMQFPILIALYYVIRFPTKYMSWAEGSALETVLSGSAEVWEKVHTFIGIRLDCSASNFMGKLPLLGGGTTSTGHEGVSCGTGSFEPIGFVYLALVLLMGFSTYFMQKQLQGRNPQMSEQAQQMQMFTKIMPFFLMFIAYSFPTGVVLYWLTTNAWTIVQQMLVLKVVPHETPPSASKGDKTAIPATATSKPAKSSPTASDGDNGQRSPTRPSKPHPSSKKKKRR